METIEAKSSIGEVSFDGRTVKIKRANPITGSKKAMGVKTIPIDRINAVQWTPAGRIIAGSIVFTVAGDDGGRSIYPQQTISEVRSKNAVTFRRKRQAEFQAVRQAIETAL